MHIHVLLFTFPIQCYILIIGPPSSSVELHGPCIVHNTNVVSALSYDSQKLANTHI